MHMGAFFKWRDSGLIEILFLYQDATSITNLEEVSLIKRYMCPKIPTQLSLQQKVFKTLQWQLINAAV